MKKLGFIGNQAGQLSSKDTPLAGVCFRTTHASLTAPSTDDCVAAIITADTAGPYDVSTNDTLKIFYSEDGGTVYRSVTVDGLAGADPEASTAAEIATDLNANTNFARWFTASNSSGSLRITSKALGANIKVYVTGSANGEFDFSELSTGTAGAGTGTAITVNATVKDAFGEPEPYAQVKVNLYNASTASTATDNFQIQCVSKGAVISGEISKECIIAADKDGAIEYQIADYTGAANSAWVEYDAGNSDYFLVTLAKNARNEVPTQS
jgi:hypothetical protein